MLSVFTIFYRLIHNHGGCRAETSVMRVAIVAPRDPVPVYTGLLERLYQLSRYLGEQHTVRIYFPYEKYRKQDEEGRVPTHQPFERVGLTHPLVELVGKHIPAYSALRGAYHLQPWLYRGLRRRLLKFDPDAVIVEMPFLVPVTLTATRGLDCQTILSEHNVEYRLAERLDIPLASILRRFETRVAGRVNAVVTVSEDDRTTLQRDLRGTEVIVAPNGVDVEQYRPRSEKEETTERIRERYELTSPVFIYHGNLGNAQNAEAVEELLEEVFPAVQREIPSASLLLLGADPPSVSHPNVVCPGVVEDLPDHISAADIALVPLRSSSGTNLKMLEYLASGIPTITTPIGAEGLPLNDGETALIRRSSGEISNAAVRLATDGGLRSRLGENGRRLAVNKFSWDVTLTPYVDLIAHDVTE